MITPMDIQNKVFSKGVRGYKEEEVDAFLDQVTVDLEKVLDENQQMKAQLKSANQEIARLKNSEGAVLDTLEAAKSLMSDISASAERRAQILIKNAELDAELIQREARESVERLAEESVSLSNRLNVFKTRYKSLLEAELDKFDTLSAELFEDDGLTELKRITEGIPVAKPREVREERQFDTRTNLRRGE